MDDQHIKPGDVIVFSVELLQSIADDEPNPVRVRVKEIRQAEDGTKVLVLARIDTPMTHFPTLPTLVTATSPATPDPFPVLEPLEPW